MAKKKETKEVLSFPSNLLVPVSDFLKAQLNLVRARKASISTEDPFNDEGRTHDNAATDTEAEEQFGHARVDAIKKELNVKMVQIKKALIRIEKGKYGICDDCGNMIDTDRLGVYPEATLCAKCKGKREK